ncbi:Mediator of RNA polymerase II transcription subunit 19-A [Ameca splendens]|uniref:Mediator of RNA polymerase II transcription subunit 19 n=1 Tax=Ameca splendens TaxID=208324 RepID=A0ABV0ZIZ7_9TELE
MFSTLFGQNEAQGPTGSSSLGFGPGKPPPPIPQNQVSMPGQMPPQLVDEGPALRKSGAMNGPFYLLRELPVGNELTGNTNLITHYNLEHAYNKFCGKKVKEKLSNFLPELPGKFTGQAAKLYKKQGLVMVDVRKLIAFTKDKNKDIFSHNYEIRIW